MRFSLHGSRVAVFGFVTATALLASNADGPRAAPRIACAPVSGGKVGALTSILSTKVFVARTNIGAAPCDLAARSQLRTDARGQAVFKLSRAGRDTRCIVLPLSSLELSPGPRDQEPVIRFTSGTTWCSTSGGKQGHFAVKSPRGEDIRVKTGNSSFGVTFGTQTLVKIESSSDPSQEVIVEDSASRNVRRVKRRQQVAVASTGRIGNPTRAAINAADRVALAQLRAAP